MVNPALDAIGGRSGPEGRRTLTPLSAAHRDGDGPVGAWSSAADLRRRRRREIVEQILDRSAMLPPADRTLMRTIFEDGRSVAEIAALAGKADPRALRRRVRRLVRRVLSNRFLFVMRNRDRWGATRRNVATVCVIHGLSIREAAAELGISLHAVRRQREAVDALYDAART